MNEFRLSRRRLLAASASIAAASLVAPTAWASSPIRIGVGSDPVFVAFYLAAHEKLFAAEGVDAALQLYADGGEAMNALVAQQVDLAAAAEPTNLVRLGRAELRPLAVVYQSGRYVKLVLGPKVKSAKDIKRFGIVPGSISEYCAGLTLAAEGINPASVTMVPSGPPELPALLARGDIDAFFAWEPWPANAVAQGGKVALTSKDVGYTDTIWLTASAAILKNDPAGLQGVLRALAKASDIARADPERGAAAVKAVTRIPVETSLKAFKDMTPIVRDFTEADLKSYDSIAKFLADHKVTKELVPYRESLQIGFYKG